MQKRCKLQMMFGLWLMSFCCFAIRPGISNVTVYPAPAGVVLSQNYRVSVSGRDVPVYTTKVARVDQGRREISNDYYDTTAFVQFDVQGTAMLTVTYAQPVSFAKILPTSAGITPVIKGNKISFRVSSPQNLTLEVNGKWVQTLHIFTNQPEINVPRPNDPNVIYFGPGIHEITNLVVGDNKTLYIAGGAVLKAVVAPGEKKDAHNGYPPSIELKGKNITLRGRGIIDGGACPTHARNLLFVCGSDIKIEGVVLCDASVWTVPVRRSERVAINSIKLFGYRSNSDGIDICNSRDVTVDHCFIRTSDDLIVVKADEGQGKVNNVVAKGCVLWNQFAHALSVGAEIREDIDNVVFSNCDIIHDQGREWSLRIFQCDSAKVSNVRFEDIRIEEARKCISLWIGKAVWSRDLERGHIQGVIFKNISASGTPLTISLVGSDDRHSIDDVLFQNVRLNGNVMTSKDIKLKAFAKNVEVRP